MTGVLQPLALKNAAGLMIVGDVRRNPKNAGVAVVVHGVASSRQDSLIQTLCNAAYEQGMTVVCYDATCGMGDSEGRLSDMRFSTYADDLASVLRWVKQQPWGVEPVTLLGHSVGAAACLHHASLHPQDVWRLVLVSSVVGGPWWLKAYQEALPDTLRMWRTQGFLPITHPVRHDVAGEISWAYAADIQQRDLIRTAAPRVACPVLLVVGSLDPITPAAAQKDLQRALAGNTTLHVIPGCGHTFKSATQQQDLKDVVTDWLAL